MNATAHRCGKPACLGMIVDRGFGYRRVDSIDIIMRAMETRLGFSCDGARRRLLRLMHALHILN